MLNIYLRDGSFEIVRILGINISRGFPDSIYNKETVVLDIITWCRFVWGMRCSGKKEECQGSLKRLHPLKFEKSVFSHMRNFQLDRKLYLLRASRNIKRVCLNGASPSILALATGNIERIAEAICAIWKEAQDIRYDWQVVEVDHDGATCCDMSDWWSASMLEHESALISVKVSRQCQREYHPPSRVCPQSPLVVTRCRLQAVITTGFLTSRQWWKSHRFHCGAMGLIKRVRQSRSWI